VSRQVATINNNVNNDSMQTDGTLTIRTMIKF